MPRRLPRRRWLAASALVLATLAVLAAVLLGGGSPRRAGADTGVPPGDTTASVTRRTLTESSTVDGTLGYGSKLELYDRLAGTFTWLPSVGAVIGRGGTLFRIDEQPVVLMYGSVPAYRALERGVGGGADVRELNENLIALGYDPYGAIADVDAFGEATAAAVKRWQKAEGLKQTGEVALGRVVFAPGARRVTEVHVSLGQDPPPATTTPATTPAPSTPPAGAPPTSTTPTTPSASPPRPARPRSKHPSSKAPAKARRPGSSKAPAQAKAPRSKTPAAKEPTSKKPASKEPASKEPAAKTPSGGDSSPHGEPQTSGGGELALSTTSTQQIVTLAVKAEQQQLARVGERVPVTLPGGDVVHGRITEVGTVASEPKASASGEKGSSGDESGEAATIAVTVALDRPVARLDEAPVSVALVRAVSRDVLTVPATALIATAGGGYAIEALQGARRVTLAVSPGMFADGYVAIEGAGVREGLTVVSSQ